MTYSIVARDAGTGQMGVAVQSHWFSVGSIVPWAKSGVGAVATQAFAEASYGPLGLELMAGGLPVSAALAALLAADESAPRRQVAMVDASGATAVHTGSMSIREAGHVQGDQFSVQANMMLRPTVPDAMAAAFSASTGDLTSRLLDALDAAESEGGDIRGRQSAALLVVAGSPTGRPYVDRIFDVRVDDSPDPLGELRRLVAVKRAYDRMNRGDDLLAADDAEGAAAEYAGAQQSVPGNVEFSFWRGVMLAGEGKVDEARDFLRVALQSPAGHWDELLRRLPEVGLLPDDRSLIESLLSP
ncbi:MAG TPA: DUF1028 domain-containing protein [Actinomycetota bacterium]|nr:DUF1028 domain-containing protein [Actinomycetota bacterium]